MTQTVTSQSLFNMEASEQWLLIVKGLEALHRNLKLDLAHAFMASDKEHLIVLNQRLVDSNQLKGKLLKEMDDAVLETTVDKYPWTAVELEVLSIALAELYCDLEDLKGHITAGIVKDTSYEVADKQAKNVFMLQVLIDMMSEVSKAV